MNHNQQGNNNNNSLLSSTYYLPHDLQLFHYSDYQTHITSSELIQHTNEKIAKVQRFIKDFNVSFGGVNILNDMSMFIDENGKYIEFVDLDHLTSHLVDTPSAGTNNTNTNTTIQPLESNSNIATTTQQVPQMLPNDELALLDRYNPSYFIPHAPPTAGIMSDDSDEDEGGIDNKLHVFSQQLASLSFYYKHIPSLNRHALRYLAHFVTAVNAIKEAKNIIIVMGAGTSTSSGVPDFRSENGLYNILGDAKDAFGADFDPDLLFDIEQFNKDPKPFYIFYYKMGVCDEQVIKPSFTHHFISKLAEQGKLLRLYTQNIDNLESRVGLKTFTPSAYSFDKVDARSGHYIPCHGNDDHFYCLGCHTRIPKSNILFKHFVLDRHIIPYCHEIMPIFQYYNNETNMNALQYSMTQRLKQKYNITHQVEVMEHQQQLTTTDQQNFIQYSKELASLKQSFEQLPQQLEKILSSPSFDQQCHGVLKPEITFFGEELPPDFMLSVQVDVTGTLPTGNQIHPRIHVKNSAQPDLIITMATSLQVSPVNMLPATFSLDGNLDSSVYNTTFLKALSTLPATGIDQHQWDLTFNSICNVPIININRESLCDRYGLFDDGADEEDEDSLLYPMGEGDGFDGDLNVVGESHVDLLNPPIQKIKPEELAYLRKTTDVGAGSYEYYEYSSNNKDTPTTTATTTTTTTPTTIPKPISNNPPKIRYIKSGLKRCNYELLGEVDAVTQFLCKLLGL